MPLVSLFNLLPSFFSPICYLNILLLYLYVINLNLFYIYYLDLESVLRSGPGKFRVFILEGRNLRLVEKDQSPFARVKKKKSTTSGFLDSEKKVLRTSAIDRGGSR